MSNKNWLELAADITTSAMGPTNNYIHDPESISVFYETVYLRIAKCAYLTKEEILKSSE